MSLWSLTQERVEKLRRQIGEIEMEVDVLIKLSKEDLWKRDLDLFIDEWRSQLDEEHNRKRRINNMGRRTSTKIKVAASGPTIKKRKGLSDDDDDDFDERPKAKKPAPPKVRRTEIIVEKKQNTLTGFFAGNGTQGKNPARNNDGNSSEIEPDPEIVVSAIADAKKMKPAVKSKTAPVPDHSDEAEIVTKPVARKARAAAAKPVQYGGGGSDTDDSNGDDLLGDITNMVKGLPGGENNSSTDKTSLFSTSRAMPNRSTSLKPAAPTITKDYAEISDDDDTNFMGLVPQQSPRRSINVTKNAQLTDDEDEDEDDIRPLTTNKSRPQATKPSKPTLAGKARPVVKSDTEAEDDKDEDGDDDVVITQTTTKSRPAASSSKPAAAAKPKASKAAAPKPAAVKKDTAPKKTKPAPAKKAPAPLSPAAKAYAAKQAKNIKKTKLLDSEDEDDAIDALADDLLDSPIPGGAGSGAKVDSDDDIDVENSPPVLKKAAAARPARRAVVEAKKKKPVYVVSDDDEEEEESDGADFGGGGGGGDEESDEDF